MRIIKWSLPSLIILVLAAFGLLSLMDRPINLLNSNYWDYHGILFLIFITIFPRLTLIISSVPFGGLLWWLGFFIAPRLLVACLATLHYGQQNPLLVTAAWIVALSGETGEKSVIKRQYNRRRVFVRR